jgi:hypothetical protein
MFFFKSTRELLLGTDEKDNGQEESEPENSYDVCEEHGHDYRDYESVGINNRYNDISKKTGAYLTFLGVDTYLLPGRLIGISDILKVSEAPCRDCGHTKSQTEIIDRQFVCRKGDEIIVVSEEKYEELKEEKQKDGDS